MDTKKCETCGEEINRPPRMGSRDWNRKRFCSQACHGRSSRGTDEARARKFIENTVRTATGCMEYQGSLQPNGYTKVTVDRVSHWTHRFVYAALVGPIPDGLDVRHKCDNRKCINPKHLTPGTRLENMGDAVSRGRQAKGERLPHTKLNPDDEIRLVELAKQGVPYQEIADIFGICKQHAGQVAIRNGVRRNGISK